MRCYRSLAFAAVLSIFASSVNAAVVYGDDIKFTYDDTTLFGTATVVGNSIFFQPTSFRAEANNLDGAVSASDTLNITAEVITTGYVMTDFVMFEAGDYFLTNGDTSVTASGRLQVSSSTTECLTELFPGYFVPGACVDSSIFNVGGLTTKGATTAWNGGTSVSLADTAGWGADTEVTVQLQNNLSATTLNLGEQAWIQKKAGLVGFEVTLVPIPPAALLFPSALGVLGWMRRRKQQNS